MKRERASWRLLFHVNAVLYFSNHPARSRTGTSTTDHRPALIIPGNLPYSNANQSPLMLTTCLAGPHGQAEGRWTTRTPSTVFRNDRNSGLQGMRRSLCVCCQNSCNGYAVAGLKTLRNPTVSVIVFKLNSTSLVTNSTCTKYFPRTNKKMNFDQYYSG